MEQFDADQMARLKKNVEIYLEYSKGF
jgi:hypothetical protein